VAVRSKTKVCSGSIAGIAGSNPVDIMDVRLLCLLRVVQVAASATSRSLVQRSPTGCVCVCVCLCVCLCVFYKPRKWGGLSPSWSAGPQKNNFKIISKVWNMRICKKRNSLIMAQKLFITPLLSRRCYTTCDLMQDTPGTAVHMPWFTDRGLRLHSPVIKENWHNSNTKLMYPYKIGLSYSLSLPLMLVISWLF
jgi:hypothetical protein